MRVPIFFLGTGIGLWLWVRRRHFYRTNTAGVEEFPNVRNVVIAGFIEWLALFSGLLVIGVGLVSGLWVTTLF